MTTTSALVRAPDAARVPYEKLGWPGLRFRLLEEAGEPMDILFRRYRFDGTVVDHEHIKHESHDGVGGMTALLESRGWTVPTMPVLQRPARPGLLRRLWLLRSYIREVRGWPSAWRTEPEWSVLGRWPPVAIALFDRARTEAYAAALKRSSASTTSGLLAALDRAAASRLLADGSPRRWMVPVNMRVTSDKAYGNVVTSVLVPFPSTRTPDDIHTAIKDMLARDLHWGAALFGDIAKRFSVERARRITLRFDPRRAIFGFVTNVGAWPPPDAVGTDDDDASTWAIVPPVGRRGPLACAVVTYRGQLAVTLKVHGCLRMDAAGVRAILDDVAAEVARVADGAGTGAVFTDDATAR